MPSSDHNQPRRPPTRIARRPVREQLPLTLESRTKLRLAQRRRRFRLILLSLAVFGSVVFVGGLGALSHYDRLEVSDIRIDGAQTLDTNALVSSARSVLFDDGFSLFSRANIFLYSASDVIAHLVNTFPRIEEISVRKESMLSQAVIISIHERVPMHTWCDTMCYYLDANGLIFDRAETRAGYIFYGGLLPGDPIGQQLLSGRLERVMNMLTELARIGFAPVSITIENESDYTVSLSAGYALKLGFDLGTEAIIQDLQLLRTSQALSDSGAIEYLDMRFGNRIYIKKKGAEEQTIE